MRNRHKVCRYFVGNYNTARSLLISPLRYTRKLLLRKYLVLINKDIRTSKRYLSEVLKISVPFHIFHKDILRQRLRTQQNCIFTDHKDIGSVKASCMVGCCTSSDVSNIRNLQLWVNPQHWNKFYCTVKCSLYPQFIR